MSRKLIIDGNAVYEIDENCMRKKREERNRKRSHEDERQKQEKRHLRDADKNEARRSR